MLAIRFRSKPGDLKIFHEDDDENSLAQGNEEELGAETIDDLAANLEALIAETNESPDQEPTLNNSLSPVPERQVADRQEPLNAQLGKNPPTLKKTEEPSQQTDVIQHSEKNAKTSEKEIEPGWNIILVNNICSILTNLVIIIFLQFNRVSCSVSKCVFLD